LQAFAQAENGWQGLDEAGEFYATYALAAHLAGKTESARDILRRAHESVDESWLTARVCLETAETIIDGQSVAPRLAWFSERGFIRWVEFIKKVVT